MRPRPAASNVPTSGRRSFLAAAGGLGLGAWVIPGCGSMSLVRSQSPEPTDTAESDGTRLVGDVAVPFGLYPVRVEGVGLVTGLPGTGSDPAPSPQRSALIAEMERRGIENPNQMLASDATDLVVVRGYLRPGIQKGDVFDVEVRVPNRSDNRGLRGGYLVETRLTETAVLDNRIHEGKLLAMSKGAILTDPGQTEQSAELQLGRGRVLAGGVSTITRQLGLVLKPDHQKVTNAALVGAAVNARFFLTERGLKRGVAKPLNKEFIELSVHPRYKDNLERYFRVVRSLPLRESSAEQASRIESLERQLLDPVTSPTAALRLEALGKDALPALKQGLAASNVEVRFYAAEALAYLDDTAAAEPLGQIARDEPALRAFALAALSAMDDFAAAEALRALLHVPSAETRYGAFRSLWAMNAQDPLVRGETLGDDGFHFHVLESAGPPMVHATRSTRAEVVLFGREQRFTAPLLLEPSGELLVRSVDEERVAVSRQSLRRGDDKRIVSSRVEDVLRALAELGGTYPDVVQALQQAAARKSLASRLEFDAVPKVGRRRDASASDEPAGSVEPESTAPAPDLFAEPGPTRGGGDLGAVDVEAAPEKKPAARSGFLARIWRRGT